MFKRLFNWLKFKTLPSSVLFKNRLFIERDSKHRRVMTNFGLTYRNSKWSDYAIKNITPSSLTTFTRLVKNLFTLIIITTIALGYTSYYNSSLTYNHLTYIIWSFFENLEYLLTYSFWSVTFTASFIFQTFYSKTFNWLYKTNYNTSIYEPTSNSVEPRSYKIEKDLRATILISALSNSTQNGVTNSLFENLFNQDIKTMLWKPYITVFKTLYLSQFLLNSTSNSLALKRLTFLDDPNISKSTLLNNHLSYNILKTDNAESTSLLNSPSTSSWNLYSFSQELNRYNSLTQGKKNIFYLNDLNFATLNNYITKYPELSFLNNSLNDQIKSIKWNRWLYRYNVLHRKTVKNSHKLTMVKKLTSGGFFDTSLMSNNIWASNFFSKNSESQVDTSSLDMIKSQYNLLYKNSFTNKYAMNNYLNPLTFTSPTSPLEMLKHFEKSYFWFVKRFYLYNTLNTNKINTTVTLLQKTDTTQASNTLHDTSLNYSFLLNNLTRSAIVTNNSTNPTYNFSWSHSQSTLPVSNSVKDINLVINESDLFNIDNLEVLNNYNNAISTAENQLAVFNSNSYTIPLSHTLLTFHAKRRDREPFTFHTSSLLNYDNKLLADMLLLTFLIK